ncbi:MAG: tetratricopeptide repeat protein [Ignavibacteriales bacterium]|nr:tetratricopeptide repeat protein [Ignavibacteriales bacterium]
MHSGTLVLLLFFLIPLGCDVWEQPLTEPEEIYEKAVELYNEKSYTEARALFERAIPMFEQLQASDKIQGGYSYLAQTNLAQGDIRLSLGNLQAALGWAKKLGDFRSEIHLNILLGDVYSAIREHTEAIRHYRSALLLISLVNDESKQAEAELKVATILFESGELEESLEGFRRAVSLYRQLGNNENVAVSLRGLAKLYRRLGQYAEGLNSIQQALETIQENQSPLLAAKLHMDLALIHRAQGDLNTALTDFRDATNILRIRREGKEYEGLLLFHIGSIYFDSRRYADAKRYYESALKIAQAQGDKIAENYLYIFIIQTNLNLMAPDQRLKSIQRLQQSYEQIAKRFREAAHRTGEAFLWTEIGKLYEENGNIQKAYEMYRTAVGLDESSLGEFIDKELHEPFLQELNVKNRDEEWYYRCANALLRLGRAGEALSTLEMAQNKHLFDLLGGIDPGIRNSQIQNQIIATRKDIQQLKILELELSNLLGNRRRSMDVQKVNKLRAEMIGLRQRVTVNAGKIAAQYPNYEPLIQPASINVSEVSGIVPLGTLVVTFLDGDEKLHLFAISSRKFEVREKIVRRDTLLSLMAEYRRLMQNPGVYAGIGGAESVPVMTRFAQLSTMLYDFLLRPVDDLIDRNLVIVVNEEMEGFPFHTLERQDRAGNVQYLIERTTVDYLPSLSSLRFKTATASRIRDVIAVGNPSGKNWSVDYELRDVRSFLKSTTVLLGQEASWKNLQAYHGDVLQLSTEFAYGRGSSPLGEMMLSLGSMLEQTEDVPFEKLTELNPFPVVLLSNQYGQGIGLSSAHAYLLRLNGTSDVFLNSWFADRKASKYFSEFFYTHLANGLAPGDAYRQALLNLIRTREVSHPRSWGQFFHFGVG